MASEYAEDKAVVPCRFHLDTVEVERPPCIDFGTCQVHFSIDGLAFSHGKCMYLDRHRAFEKMNSCQDLSCVHGSNASGLMDVLEDTAVQSVIHGQGYNGRVCSKL